MSHDKRFAMFNDFTALHSRISCAQCNKSYLFLNQYTQFSKLINDITTLIKLLQRQATRTLPTFPSKVISIPWMSLSTDCSRH